jgi:hypothetical protein
MQLDSLKQKLIAAARQDAPSDRVPFAFEKRIMARLAGAGVPDGWILEPGALAGRHSLLPDRGVQRSLVGPAQP